QSQKGCYHRVRHPSARRPSVQIHCAQIRRVQIPSVQILGGRTLSEPVASVPEQRGHRQGDLQGSRRVSTRELPALEQENLFVPSARFEPNELHVGIGSLQRFASRPYLYYQYPVSCQAALCLLQDPTHHKQPVAAAG